MLEENLKVLPSHCRPFFNGRSLIQAVIAKAKNKRQIVQCMPNALHGRFRQTANALRRSSVRYNSQAGSAVSVEINLAIAENARNVACRGTFLRLFSCSMGHQGNTE
jgi:hypothetical protein